MSNTKIGLTCKVVQKYYSSFGVDYDAIFSTWCDENGFDDDDAIEEEFKSFEASNPTDWMLADFDENNTFPFKHKPTDNTDKCKSIYKFMKMFWDNCDNPNVSFNFSAKIPEFKSSTFEIKEEDITMIKRIYAEQCPALYNSGMQSDRAFLKLLAIGYKNDFNYLQCLVDDYFRDRLAHINDEKQVWNVEDWKRGHKHFNNIKNIPFSTVQTAQDKSIPSKSQQPKTVGALVEAAVQSFRKRVCPMLQFTATRKINDSLDHLTKYIEAGFGFIANVFNEAGEIKTKRAICPFQFDMCIASNKPKISLNQMKNNNCNSDDDDDDFDEKKLKLDENQDTFVDCVGNIEKKLKVNKLNYKMQSIPVQDTNFLQTRVFLKLFNQFEDKHQPSEIHDKFYYLHKKRLIAMVDRRDSSKDELNDEKQNMDTVYLYEPPSNCASIPKDAVNEWYISSSKTCLLPCLDYGDGKAATKVFDPKSKELQGKGDGTATIDNLKNSNIGSSFHCKGALLTVSFHVQSMEEIKSYLYWNGQMTRFMPKDIKTLFPILFNMNYKDNKQFINSDEIDMRIAEMNKILKDINFEGFRQSYM